MPESVMTLCFLPKIFARLRLVLLDRQVIDLGRDTIHTVSSGFMRPEGKITTKQGSYESRDWWTHVSMDRWYDHLCRSSLVPEGFILACNSSPLYSWGLLSELGKVMTSQLLNISAITRLRSPTQKGKIEFTVIRNLCLFHQIHHHKDPIVQGL